MKIIVGILGLALFLMGCKDYKCGCDDNVAYRFVVLDPDGKNLIDSSVTITPQRPPYYRNFEIHYPLSNTSDLRPTTKYGGYWLEMEPDLSIQYTINKGDKKLATLEFMGNGITNLKFNEGEPFRMDSTVIPFVFVLQLK